MHGVRGSSGGVPARGPGFSPDLCPPRGLSPSGKSLSSSVSFPQLPVLTGTGLNSPRGRGAGPRPGGGGGGTGEGCSPGSNPPQPHVGGRGGLAGGSARGGGRRRGELSPRGAGASAEGALRRGTKSAGLTLTPAPGLLLLVPTPAAAPAAVRRRRQAVDAAGGGRRPLRAGAGHRPHRVPALAGAGARADERGPQGRAQTQVRPPPGAVRHGLPQGLGLAPRVPLRKPAGLPGRGDLKPFPGVRPRRPMEPHVPGDPDPRRGERRAPARLLPALDALPVCRAGVCLRVLGGGPAGRGAGVRRPHRRRAAGRDGPGGLPGILR